MLKNKIDEQNQEIIKLKKDNDNRNILLILYIDII